MNNNLLTFGIIVLLSTLIIFLTTTSFTQNEHFETRSKQIDLNKLGNNPKDYALLNDDFFRDIIVYENDIELNGKTGIEKCIMSCDGVCTEHGITGIGFCFPNKK